MTLTSLSMFTTVYFRDRPYHIQDPIFKVFQKVKPMEKNLGVTDGMLLFILIESGMALFSVQLRSWLPFYHHFLDDKSMAESPLCTWQSEFILLRDKPIAADIYNHGQLRPEVWLIRVQACTWESISIEKAWLWYLGLSSGDKKIFCISLKIFLEAEYPHPKLGRNDNGDRLTDK